VVALELAIVWGLLTRNAWLFWGALAQFAVFHVFSWPVVGFFYPILMFLILAIFPLRRLLAGPAPHGRAGAIALALLFSALQLSPYLFPGDRVITGEGRLFALHMFDSLVACRAWADVRYADGRTRQINLRRHTEARTARDPIVIRGFARQICQAREEGGVDFVGIDVHLLSRRAQAAEDTLRTVIDFPDFCARMPPYSMFRHNDWILTDGPPVAAPN
jgi:hypothetical protein